MLIKIILIGIIINALITIMLSIPIKNEDFDSNLFVGFMVTTFIPYSLLVLCIYVILEKEN